MAFILTKYRNANIYLNLENTKQENLLIQAIKKTKEII